MTFAPFEDPLEAHSSDEQEEISFLYGQGVSEGRFAGIFRFEVSDLGSKLPRLGFKPSPLLV